MPSIPNYTIIENLANNNGSHFIRAFKNDSPNKIYLIFTHKNDYPSSTNLSRINHEYELHEKLNAIEHATHPLFIEKIEKQHILAFENIQAIQLNEYLEKKSPHISILDFLNIACQITIALEEIHRNGLIHQDIKPEHIFLNPDDYYVWITGFGISSQLARTHQDGLLPEAISGTMAYMSPEQTGRMNRSIDTRSDLYSLGILFYQILTTKLPFYANETIEWIHCHIARPPMPITEYRKDIPTQIHNIIFSLLEKTAEDRYQTATGLLYDLNECLLEFNRTNHISNFILGLNDFPNKLIIPEKLYGREADVAKLINLFKKSFYNEHIETVMISGYSGIGKSAIVNELQRSITQTQGFFISGKFEQYKRDIPHATISDAFQKLIYFILCKKEATILEWKSTIEEALFPYAQLIIDLIPNLELVIGKQPSIPPLPYAQIHNLFQETFKKFVSIFATKEHPLVLFLDDLQWIDNASLSLIEYLINHSENSVIFLVFAYRDNELNDSHPLSIALKKNENNNPHIHKIELNPLSLEHTISLIQDALLCSRAQSLSLAELIHKKTEGNPFFIIQFLHELVEEQLLFFNNSKKQWEWNIKKIKEKGVTDNVVTLMTKKIQRLSENTTNLLKKLACLGTSTSIDTLLQIENNNESILDTTFIKKGLWEAVQAGFIFQHNDHYKFCHDRIQEAAYQLIPEESRAIAHLKIGRILANNIDSISTEHPAIFDITNHFNKGISLITEHNEIILLKKLNIISGKKSKLSTAYASAKTHFLISVSCLNDFSWDQDYHETFSLYINLLECEYLTGNFDKADELSLFILSNIDDISDKAKIYSLRMQLHQLAGHYEEAINTGFEALKLFNIQFYEDTFSFEEDMKKELNTFKEHMKKNKINALLYLPTIKNNYIKSSIDLLVDMTPCMAIARPGSRNFPLLVLKAVNLSIMHGNTEKSCYAYTIHARALITDFRDVTSSLAFADMALSLNEKFNDLSLKGNLLFIHGSYLSNWQRNITESITLLDRAFTNCFNTGNYVYASFSCFFLTMHIMEKGHSIEEVFKSAKKYTNFSQNIHNKILETSFSLYLHTAELLKTPLQNSNELHYNMITEEYFNTLTKGRFAPGIASYYILKQFISFLFEDYDTAENIGKTIFPSLIPGGYAQASYLFYQPLTQIAQYRKKKHISAEAFDNLMTPLINQLKFLSDSCQNNYLNRYELVIAEYYSVRNQLLEAEDQYEKSILSARKNGFIHHEALAQECAGKFYLSRNLNTIATHYLACAYHNYLRWGAIEKASHLEKTYPFLSDYIYNEFAIPTESSIKNLDILGIIKASETITSEIIFDELIKKLLTLVLAHAGASRALFIMKERKEFIILAEAKAEKNIDIFLLEKPPSADDLPESIFHYVSRTKEIICLEDATTNTTFLNDDYIKKTQTKSILFLPLIKQNVLIGMLYLENNLSKNVFTQNRLSTLEILSTQASISIENARLYRAREKAEKELSLHKEHLEEMIYDRTKELKETQYELMETARQAGMAEIAINVLHNIGNVLNSVNISANIIQSTLNTSKIHTLNRAIALIKDNRESITSFLSDDPKGKLLPDYLIKSNESIQNELKELNNEINSLTKNIDHIKEIVSTQQEYAKHTQTLVPITVKELIEDALKMNYEAIIKQHIEIIKIVPDLPILLLDKTRILQILVNFISNAKHAMSPSAQHAHTMTIRVVLCDDSLLKIAITDTGTGITEENMKNLFTHGFTTKTTGHGFGLHSCALAAKSMNGTIHVQSDGIGKGATFTLEVPIKLFKSNTPLRS